MPRKAKTLEPKSESALPARPLVDITTPEGKGKFFEEAHKGSGFVREPAICKNLGIPWSVFVEERNNNIGFARQLGLGAVLLRPDQYAQEKRIELLRAGEVAGLCAAASNIMAYLVEKWHENKDSVPLRKEIMAWVKVMQKSHPTQIDTNVIHSKEEEPRTIEAIIEVRHL